MRAQSVIRDFFAGGFYLQSKYDIIISRNDRRRVSVEDKTFELLTKMYGEFTEFREDMNGFREETKEDIRSLKNDVLRIENEHGSELEALLDGYKQTYEKLDAIEDKLDTLSEKVDRHDIKIQVIEGGRK
jgi:uncharacterized protein YaaR (DUF327 family)